MKELIDSTRTKLGESTLLKYIDENWGQIDFMIAPPVKWPCALLSIFNAQFSNIGRDHSKVPQNRQMGDMVVELRVANLRLTPSSGRASVQQKSNSLSIFDVLEEIHELLQGWSPGPKYGSFIRTRASMVKRDDGVQEYIVQYTTGASDV